MFQAEVLHRNPIEWSIPPTFTYVWVLTIDQISPHWLGEPSPPTSSPGEGEWRISGDPVAGDIDTFWDPWNEPTTYAVGDTRSRNGSKVQHSTQDWVWYRKTKCE